MQAWATCLEIPLPLTRTDSSVFSYFELGNMSGVLLNVIEFYNTLAIFCYTAEIPKVFTTISICDSLFPE